MTTTQRSFPVCILGLGLIGGSLLRDLTAAGWPVFGWNRSAATVEAATGEDFDVSADLPAVLARAEAEGALIVLGVPVPALSFLLDAIRTHAPSVGITDVTSVKEEVLRLVDDAGLADRYVGGHPMAGTAESGWSATFTGLFQEAAWVVAYDDAAVRSEHPLWLQTFTRVVVLAEAVGAVAIPTCAARHDRAVARISHLPHVLAETLSIVGDRGGALSLALAASSYRDATRVAGTAPGLVRAMCENNREALLDAMDEAIELLRGARSSLGGERHDLRALVADGHTARSRYEARMAAPHSVIRVQPGAPGWVEQLESAESIGAQISVF